MEKTRLKRKWIVAAIFASSFGAFALPAAVADVGISVNVAPPAPIYEPVPQPRAGYVWAPGYWDYRDGHHDWRKGHWERERYAENRERH